MLVGLLLPVAVLLLRLLPAVVVTLVLISGGKSVVKSRFLWGSKLDGWRVLLLVSTVILSIHTEMYNCTVYTDLLYEVSVWNVTVYDKV